MNADRPVEYPWCRVSHVNTVGYGLSERKQVGENGMRVSITCIPSILKGQHS